MLQPRDRWVGIPVGSFDVATAVEAAATVGLGSSSTPVAVISGVAGGVPQPARSRIRRRIAQERKRSFFMVYFPLPRMEYVAFELQAPVRGTLE